MRDMSPRMSWETADLAFEHLGCFVWSLLRGSVLVLSVSNEKHDGHLNVGLSGLRAVRVECSQGFGKLAGVDFGSDLTGLGLAR